MKKTFLFLSVAAAMTLASCGGQAGGSGNVADSLAETELADSLVRPGDDAGVIMEEDDAETSEINAALVGRWSNNVDPSIDMVFSDKQGDHDGRMGYGYVSPVNDYFEYEYALVFKSIVPDGDNVKVHYDKMNIDYGDGDMGDDDFEGAGEEKVGEGDLTIIFLGGNKLKLDTTEPLLRNKILYKN